MDRQRLEIMDGVEIALAVQHRAHAVGRPTLDLAAEIAEQPDVADDLIAVVDFGDVKPAILRIDTGGAFGRDGVADVVDPGLRQRPERSGALEAHAANQLVSIRGEARQYETGIAAGGAGSDAVRLQQHDGPAGFGELTRRRKAR